MLTVPLLEGTDGAEKMSKSLGNAIGIRESPEEMYGKTMSIPDSLLVRWVELLARPEWELGASLEAVRGGLANPRDLKAALARALVARFHGPAAADAGGAALRSACSASIARPDDVPVVEHQSVGSPAACR